MKIIACLTVIWTVVVTAIPACATGVGYSRMVTADPMGGEMQVSLWYPADHLGGVVRVGPFSFQAVRDAEPADGRRGLVVISHGSAGSDLGHRNVAIALAQAGFVVAAPLHPRDNFRDRRGVGHSIVFEGRPRQVSAVVDALMSVPKWREHVDPKRIGVFGFSLGGYSALAVLGASPDMARNVRHCEKTPQDPYCRLLGDMAIVTGRAIDRSEQPDTWDLSDPRFCAAVIADPVAAPFSDKELAGIKARFVQIWRPERQNLLLADAHASRVVRQLNSRNGMEETEEIVVAGAQHYSFLAPFPAALRTELPRELTTDSPDFDRAEFQRRFATRTVAFMRASLVRCGVGK